MNKYEVFANVLSKYQDDTLSHLDEMSIDELCNHRASITKKLKQLDEERRQVDDNIMNYLSEAELKRGVSLKNGGILKSRSRTSYKYPDEVGITINELRKRSRDTGEAEELVTTYLVVIDA